MFPKSNIGCFIESHSGHDITAVLCKPNTDSVGQDTQHSPAVFGPVALSGSHEVHFIQAEVKVSIIDITETLSCLQRPQASYQALVTLLSSHMGFAVTESGLKMADIREGAFSMALTG